MNILFFLAFISGEFAILTKDLGLKRDTQFQLLGRFRSVNNYLSPILEFFGS